MPIDITTDAAASPQPANRPAVSGVSTVIQFLSLYLLVLAFFILLVSISTIEKVKSRAVMDSLNSTFASVFPPAMTLTTFTGKEGPLVAAQSFQQDVKALFATPLGVEKIEIMQPGRLMRVVMELDSLFLDDSTRVRESQIPLIDRLIVSLSGRPAGVHYDMEFVIGAEPGADRKIGAGQNLQMARAGAFVRAMLARGAPPDSISIGVRTGDPRIVVMWFYVRSSREVRAYIEKINQPVKADGGQQ